MCTARSQLASRSRNYFTTVSQSVSQSVCLGVGHPFGAHDQMLLFPLCCRKIALLFLLGHPLSREDWSVICSAISTCWLKRLPRIALLKLKLKLLYDWRSVSQYVLVSRNIFLYSVYQAVAWIPICVTVTLIIRDYNSTLTEKRPDSSMCKIFLDDSNERNRLN
jgi:hypothetical protein